MQDCVPIILQTNRGKKALIDSGALDMLVQIQLEMSDPKVRNIKASDEI